MRFFEGGFIGWVCSSFVWVRKDLCHRLALDDEGLAVPDGKDE